MTYRHSSQELGIAVSSVARWLKRLGLNRLASLEPAPPIVRYRFEHPGDLLHLHISKLAAATSLAIVSRGIVQVALDDASRIAFSSPHPDERATRAGKALLQALRYHRSPGITFTRPMTDNGACDRSRLFARLVRRLGPSHRFTKPYTPRPNCQPLAS